MKLKDINIDELSHDERYLVISLITISTEKFGEDDFDTLEILVNGKDVTLEGIKRIAEAIDKTEEDHYQEGLEDGRLDAKSRISEALGKILDV